ncbi:MAG: FAD-dependent oxidoreductase [Opitutaceae bacterium]|nr:FAD-dependent oxidoreductase [Opitutaceae bacterium]
MSKETEHHLDCEVLVAGGGPAGVCCALAAARLGAKVILCQDRPVLGGNASSEVRMHIVGATGLRGGVALETELREGGIVEELRLDLAVHNPQRSPSMMDLLLFDKCRREPNLTLLLNTTVDRAEVADGRVRRVSAVRPSTEDRFHIAARIFVDCTGDGRLGLEAGAPFRHGREARAEFDEVLAPAAADGRTLGSTLLFQARKHPRPMPFVAPPWVRKFQPGDFRLRPFGKPGSDLGLEYGYWWAEWGGCLDTIKDNERIRDELLAIILGVWNHIKNESGMDASHWALEWFGFLPGKRESRRFVGRHVLTESDVFRSRAFPDAIAYGGWPIDTHPPEGVDAPELPPCEQHHLPHLYDIPLRACVSAGPANLMFAGRNLSATHIAFASTRVMATCAVVGQGVGTAAALALRAGVTPAEAADRPELVAAIQQQLLKDDCYLLGVPNADPGDLVRRAAAVVSSSAQAGGEAELVRSGQTRSVHGRPAAKPASLQDNLWDDVLKRAETGDQPDEVTCAPPDRARPGRHRWMSDPARGLPAWLEVRWAEPVRVREVLLVFDTGQHRHLTLSQADGYTASMQWGRPQAETVRDYRIEVPDGAGWREVARVEGNYQRRRHHVLARPVDTPALRVTVTATNGIDHARIFEVRAYGTP